MYKNECFNGKTNLDKPLRWLTKCSLGSQKDDVVQVNCNFASIETFE